MLSEREAVIAHINDERRFAQAALVQIAQDATEVLVQSVHGLAITCVQVVERWHGIVVILAGFHVVDAVDAVAPLADPVRLRLVVTFGIRHGFGALDLGLSVAALMAFGRLEGIVDGLE